MRRSHQKLHGSSRGDGELRSPKGDFRVRYELDRFSDKNGPRASGSVSGDVAALGDDEVPAVLVLQDGSQIRVLVSNAAADGADIEATDLPA